MATGIILIVLSGLGFILASGVDNEDLRIALYVGPFVALVAGIGLVLLARRIGKWEKELEMARARRIVRQELEEEKE